MRVYLINTSTCTLNDISTKKSAVQFTHSPCLFSATGGGCEITLEDLEVGLFLFNSNKTKKEANEDDGASRSFLITPVNYFQGGRVAFTK